MTTGFGDEDRRNLVGTTRPDSRQQDPENTPLRCYFAERDERAPEDSDRGAHDHWIETRAFSNTAHLSR